MDASAKPLAVLAVVLMLVCCIPVSCDCQASDAMGDNGGILLFQVNPTGDDEGVTLKNYSNGTVDLKGYAVYDNYDGSREGCFRFTSSLDVPAGGTVTVVKKVTSGYFCDNKPVYALGEAGIQKERSFDLAKSGDDVYLRDPSDRIVDAVCYGSVTIKDQKLWFGPSVGDRDGFYFERTGTYDSDSSDDWFNVVPGLTNMPFELDRFDATVTPFLFPESGGIPVYQALEQARDTVYIEMYELRSTNICALLVDLEKRGVDVVVLHEAKPFGDTVKEFSSELRFLVDNGAEVRLINGTDVDRFVYVHAKFAVIDGSKVIVTSENWSNANMNGKFDSNPYDSHKGNRGWGAIVESNEYASYMTDIFENDSSFEYGDVANFLDRYPNSVASSPTYTAPEDHEFPSYSAKITPVLSNDNSYEATKYFIENAKERIYSQQQDLTGDFADCFDPTSPIYMMDKRADEGVDAKFILGGYGKDGMAETEGIVKNINLSTDVSAAAMKDPYVHNKGIVSDDYVLVSSINWTPNSMFNNRESCVAIHSKEVSDFFARSFSEDFERYYTYDGFRIDTSLIEDTYEEGSEVVFEISVLPEDDYTYEWDFGDGGVRETTIPKVLYSPANGTHVLKITVTNPDGMSETVQRTYTMLPPDETSDLLDGYIAYIIPILVIIIAVVAAVRKLR